MKVVPVIDVLGGVAVHAMRGEREKYKPLKSVLCKSVNPVDVAKAFEAAGFTQLYIADLDAIMGKQPSLSVLKKTRAETNLNVMIDAGINTIERARKLLETCSSSIVIGTETLKDLGFIGAALREFGAEKVVVSIDMAEGEVISTSDSIKRYKPAPLAETLQNIGVVKVLILDIKRVGSEQGVNLALVKEIIERTNLEVLTGGGIRNITDLEELSEIGVSGALVATALHKGAITPQILKAKGYL